jgi:hypothetical protein
MRGVYEATVIPVRDGDSWYSLIVDKKGGIIGSTGIKSDAVSAIRAGRMYCSLVLGLRSSSIHNSWNPGEKDNELWQSQPNWLW